VDGTERGKDGAKAHEASQDNKTTTSSKFETSAMIKEKWKDAEIETAELEEQ
jgi:hypothetical protein